MGIGGGSLPVPDGSWRDSYYEKYKFADKTGFRNMQHDM